LEHLYPVSTNVLIVSGQALNAHSSCHRLLHCLIEVVELPVWVAFEVVHGGNISLVRLKWIGCKQKRAFLNTTWFPPSLKMNSFTFKWSQDRIGVMEEINLMDLIQTNHLYPSM
jgi:hypothetical protein